MKPGVSDPLPMVVLFFAVMLCLLVGFSRFGRLNSVNFFRCVPYEYYKNTTNTLVVTNFVTHPVINGTQEFDAVILCTHFVLVNKKLGYR